MWFATLILRNIWNRKVRSGLTALGMGIAVCTVVTLFGVIDIYEGAVVRIYEARNVDVIVARAGVAQALLGRMDQDLTQKLTALSGVTSVEPMLLDFVNFKKPKLDAVYVFGWDPAGSMFEQIHPTAGELLKPGDKDKLLLGTTLAHNLNVGPGKTILIEQTPVEVAGIFESGNVMQDSSAIMPLTELQKLMQEKNKVTLFLVRVVDGPNKDARIEALCQEIEAVKDDDDRQVMTASDTRKHINSAPGATGDQGPVVLHLVHRLGHRRDRHAEHDDDLGVRADARDRHAAGGRLAAAVRHDHDHLGDHAAGRPRGHAGSADVDLPDLVCLKLHARKRSEDPLPADAGRRGQGRAAGSGCRPAGGPVSRVPCVSSSAHRGPPP